MDNPTGHAVFAFVISAIAFMACAFAWWFCWKK